MNKILFWIIGITVVALAGCAPAAKPPASEGPKVIAAESFLTDIAQNVAGDRVVVESLIPRGTDPHTFEPTPQDIKKIEDAHLVFISGAGLEEGLQNYLENISDHSKIVEASEGIAFREPGQYEMVEDEHEGEGEGEDDHEGEGDGEHHQHENDPHFWFDPNLVMTYVENIRDALIEVDPEGADTFNTNADDYIAELVELDAYIQSEVDKIPVERRKLVMDHVSFGYFADRFGFEIIGAVIPSVSTGASPTPQEMAALIDRIQETGAAAIFIPATENPDLAALVAKDAGVVLITGLYTHSVSEADGPAPTYIAMMRLNTNLIVEALE